MVKLQEYEGDFNKFTKDDLELLSSLKDGFIAYDDIIHILIDHHDDEEAGHHIFEAHPELHDYMPKEYDNDEHVLEVLLEVVRDYQWQLEHFSTKHAKMIDAALSRLGVEEEEDDLPDLPLPPMAFESEDENVSAEEETK